MDAIKHGSVFKVDRETSRSDTQHEPLFSWGLLASELNLIGSFRVVFKNTAPKPGLWRHLSSN